MNLARVLVTICVVFLLCNSLRLFLGLQAIINVDITITCVSHNKAWIPPNWMLIMESVSHLLLLVSSSSNFLIYCAISTKFKIYIKRKLFWRSSPLVNVPEINSRIALRTIGKSSNEAPEADMATGGGPGPDGSVTQMAGTTSPQELSDQPFMTSRELSLVITNETTEATNADIDDDDKIQNAPFTSDIERNEQQRCVSRS